MSLHDLEKVNLNKLVGIVVIFIFFIWCLKQIVNEDWIVLCLVFLFIIMLATSTELKQLARIFGKSS